MNIIFGRILIIRHQDRNRGVAQLIAHWTLNPKVEGSNPSASANHKDEGNKMNNTLKFLYLYFLDRDKLMMHYSLYVGQDARYYARNYIEVYGSVDCKRKLRYW